MMHDDDLHADAAIFRSNGGNGLSYWYIWDSKTWSPTTIQWGLPGDLPFAANFGTFATFFPAVFRSTTSQWLASNGTMATNFGVFPDIPVVSDYDGNGIYNFAFFRPTTGQWWSHDAPQGTNTHLLVAHGGVGDFPMAPFHRGDGWPP